MICQIEKKGEIKMEKVKNSNCSEVNVDELLNTLKEEASTKGIIVCVDK